MSRELEFYLEKIKEYGVYLVAFFVFLVLASRVLLPQIEDVFENRALLLENSQRVTDLDKKIKVLESLDKAATEQKLQRLNLALPAQKDVGMMLSVIEQVALRSNVSLGTFSLSVGSLEATASNAVKNPKIGVPSLEVKLSLRGGIDDISRFISQLRHILPVMQVADASISPGTSTITLFYYFKPPAALRPAGRVDMIPQISKKQEEVWQNVVDREILFLTSSDFTQTSSRPDPFH